MTPVESSNIHSIGYDAPSRTMHIKFKSGGHYTYADVPPEVHQEFMGAESKGKHFKSSFAGKYEHKKLEMH
jgi:hypothetical protein